MKGTYAKSRFDGRRIASFPDGLTQFWAIFLPHFLGFSTYLRTRLGRDGVIHERCSNFSAGFWRYRSSAQFCRSFGNGLWRWIRGAFAAIRKVDEQNSTEGSDEGDLDLKRSSFCQPVTYLYFRYLKPQPLRSFDDISQTVIRIFFTVLIVPEPAPPFPLPDVERRTVPRPEKHVDVELWRGRHPALPFARTIDSVLSKARPPTRRAREPA